MNEGSNVETLYKLHEDQIEALEFRARRSSKTVGTAIMDLNLKNDLQIICISRAGKVIIPHGNDMIMPDDLVVVVTKHKGLNDLDDILNRR